MVEIPGYRDMHLIGQGATAQVYRAVQVSTGQLVAIKMLKSELQTRGFDQSEHRLSHELRLCAQLHNPYIVRLMDQGICADGSPYVVFEYIPGHSLARHIVQRGPLGPSQAKELMLQALDALAYAHTSGIIHRDLKPQNLMVTQTGPRLTLKVLDFGIGIWLNPLQVNGSERLSLAHENQGTPAYCAPEQLKGETPGVQSDLYAWGLIFIECLTGKPVVTGATTAEIIRRQLSAEEVALPSFIAQHPVAHLLRGVLNKDPVRRTTDAAVLYEALAGLNFADMLPPTHSMEYPREDQDTQTIPNPEAIHHTELRPLTLLCCKLKILTIGDIQPPNPAALEQLLADKLATSQALLSRFGGYPANALGGGVMAYFGYPYHTDQGARLAARTSLELRRTIQSWNWELAPQGLRCVIQQAIHSGVAPLIKDKPLISELSNVVLGMLFMPATDQILVSATSHRLLQDYAKFTLSPNPLQLETDEQIAIYLLKDEQAVDQPLYQDMELFGRCKELEVLQQWWNDSTESSQAVVVLGDAGMGKSTLVKSFTEQIRATGNPCLFLRCLPEYHQSALHPILKGLEQALGLTRSESVEARRTRLHQSLTDAGVDDASTFEVLCYWLNVPSANPEQRQHFSPERQKQLLYMALYPLILTLGRQRGQQGILLLVIEDIHWLDSVSLEFIKTLQQQTDGGRMLLLTTSRPRENLDELLQWIPHQLPLPPLAEPASLTLAQWFLGERANDLALVRKLVERSGGVPLFIRELAHMADSSQLDTELPLSLTDILGSRINALRDAKATAQWAAVLGDNLQTDWLADLMSATSAQVQTQLHSLCETGLLYREQDSPEHGYGFTHALYRDAAYQQITAHQRCEMHNRVARLCENRLSRDEHFDAALIARHYAKGRSFLKAARFALQAVRDNLGMALSQQALEMISELLKWSENLPDSERHNVQLQAYELRGQASTHQLGWAHPTVLDNVQKTQEFMQQKALLSTHKVKAATLWSLGTFYHVSSQRAMVHQVAGQLVDMADNLLDDGLAILGECLHGQGHWIDGHYDQAEENLCKVRTLYDPAQHQILARDYTLDAHVWATSSLGLVCWFQGKVDGAHQYTRQATERARAMGHMPSLGIAMMYQAFVHQYEQDRSKANEVATELLSLANTYGLSAVMGYASAIVGWATNDLERITATLGQLKGLGCLLGVTYLQSMAAEVSLRQGDTTQALDLLNEGLQIAQETGEQYFLTILYQQKAHCLLSAGLPAQSVLQCLDRARQLSQAQAIRLNNYQYLFEDYRDDQRLAPYWSPSRHQKTVV